MMYRGTRARGLQLSVRRGDGYTLIEMLSVMLVFTILMVMAVVLYLNATKDSYKRACRANMQSLANAEQQFRIKDPNHQYTTNLSSLAGEMAGIPICPSGGAYSLSLDKDGNLIVQCGFQSGKSDAHGSFTPGVDNE